MRKLFFIVIFFLGFPLVSPAEASHDHSTCDENKVWIDRVAWADHVISTLKDCEDESTHYCTQEYEPCRGKAESILEEKEKRAKNNRDHAKKVIQKINDEYMKEAEEKERKEEKARREELRRRLKELE